MDVNGLLDKLFRTHKQELVVFAEQKGNYQNAEDLVQETFLRLLEHTSFQEIENHRAYLFKIASNLSANQYRDKSFIDQINLNESDFSEIVCVRPEPDSVAEGLEKYLICMKALDDLPDMIKTVFLLHRVDGVLQTEIAVAFDLPLRTVERYCAKALAHCCETLKNSQN